jgi:hypothetical protein
MNRKPRIVSALTTKHTKDTKKKNRRTLTTENTENTEGETSKSIVIASRELCGAAIPVTLMGIPRKSNGDLVLRRNNNFSQ